MKRYTLLIITLLISITTLNTRASEEDIATSYFSKKKVVLTKQEKAAVAIARRWKANSANGMKPVAGPDGTVVFMFGTQQITIVCAVLQACDVELQIGETVHNLNVGDPRFIIEPAVSGSGMSQIEHLIIKPQDVGLESSLIVTTNKRTYHMNLRSHRTAYLPKVRFKYQEDVMAKWESIRKTQVKEIQERTMPKTGENINDLDFDYNIVGKAPWKPVRVYNNGVKTIIEIGDLAGKEAPALLLVRKDGGWLRSDDNVEVNYRIKEGGRYVVDSLFTKAILIAGAGKSQKKITITRGK